MSVWVLRIACGLLLSASLAFADDPAPMSVRSAEGQALLQQGRDQMVAFRLDEAERTFERLARAEPQSGAAARHLAAIALWRAIAMETDAHYEVFFARSDALLQALRRAEPGPWVHLFRGETELHRAAVHARRQEYARAARAMRRAYGHFSRNARDHPDFYESRWGMGVAYAAVGAVPGGLRWLLGLFGFRGTVSGGLAEIEASMQRSRFYREEAALYYGLLDASLNESRRGGLRHLHAVQARYPDSPLALYLQGFAYLSQRRAAEAERALARARLLEGQEGVHPIPHIDFRLGVATFRQNRFDDAIGHFERFLARFQGMSDRGRAALHAGLAHEMLDDRASALRYYRLVLAMPERAAGAPARRAAEARLAVALTPRQRDLLLGRNAFDGGRYAEALTAVQRVLNDFDAPAVERAEAAYRAGRAHQALGQWDEALRHFQFAVANPGDPLAKWGPWAQFFIGEVHAARGDRPAARQAYQRALAHHEPFEYHRSLEQRARAALEQL